MSAETVETFWNGEPTPARRVIIEVGAPLMPTWWCASLEGTRRNAVAVDYYGDRFYLDDEDGTGWHKVTDGHGSPNVGHRSLPDSSVEVAER